jgi:hypothetical protein
MSIAFPKLDPLNPIDDNPVAMFGYHISDLLSFRPNAFSQSLLAYHPAFDCISICPRETSVNFGRTLRRLFSIRSIGIFGEMWTFPERSTNSRKSLISDFPLKVGDTNILLHFNMSSSPSLFDHEDLGLPLKWPSQMVEWHGLARMKKLISDQFLNLNGWHFDPV